MSNQHELSWLTEPACYLLSPELQSVPRSFHPLGQSNHTNVGGVADVSDVQAAHSCGYHWAQLGGSLVTTVQQHLVNEVVHVPWVLRLNCFL